MGQDDGFILDNKVMKAKLQVYIMKFESLKQNEENSIGKLFLDVDEIIDTIRGIDEKMDGSPVVQNVLRSLPAIFNSKVSTIQEMENLSTLTMDQLHRLLTSYEIRTTKGRSTSKEVTFKDNKNAKEYQKDSSYGFDEEEAKLLKRLKRRFGKYKSKIPFKCFTCGKVCHYASKSHIRKKLINMNIKKRISIRDSRRKETQRRIAFISKRTIAPKRTRMKTFGFRKNKLFHANAYRNPR